MCKTIRLWWRTWVWARRINKRLLALAKETPPSPYAPPTQEEIKDFMSEMAAKGITFNSMCVGVPKTPSHSREVTL